MTRSRNGADALVQTLANAGVKRIFTLSGNHIMPVFDACIDANIDLIRCAMRARRCIWRTRGRG